MNAQKARYAGPSGDLLGSGVKIKGKALTLPAHGVPLMALVETRGGRDYLLVVYRCPSCGETHTAHIRRPFPPLVQRRTSCRQGVICLEIPFALAITDMPGQRNVSGDGT